MRKELGAILKLIEYAEPADYLTVLSEFDPQDARCKKCFAMLPGWHPKPPPSVKLMTEEEVMAVPLLGLPIVHEAVYDVLQEHWPEAVVTRCSSHPKSKRKLGKKYLSVSLPAKYHLNILYPSGEPWKCRACGRWRCDGKWTDPYVVLRPEQEDVAAFVNLEWLLINPPLREPLKKLGLGTIGWETIPVFSEPLPHHRIPRK